MDPLALEIGRALRRARRARGLTLRELTRQSAGRFKATSVAGYERGERTISVERFCELCVLYGVAPQVVLGDILLAVGGGSEREIDLWGVEVEAWSGSSHFRGLKRCDRRRARSCRSSCGRSRRCGEKPLRRGSRSGRATSGMQAGRGAETRGVSRA